MSLSGHRSNGRLPLVAIALLGMAGCSDGGVVGGRPDAGAGDRSSPPPQGSGGSGGATSAGGGGGTQGMGSQGGTGGSGGTPTTPPADSGAGPDIADGGAAEGGLVVTDPGTEGDGNSTISSPFQRAADTMPRADGPKGRIINFSLNGANSVVYPGAYMRPAAVYIPAGYVSGTEIPFMTAQDGLNFGYFNRLVTMVDNMAADGRLPAMAIIGSNPTNRRSVEYDTVSDAFTRFVETELLPEAKRQAMMMANVDLKLTDNPEGRGTFGGSSGGVCAFTMGWFGNFRRLLTVSGSFTPLQRNAEYPMGAAEYQNHLIAEAATKPLRVFLHAGSNDAPPINGGTSWRVANDRVAAALGTKGYHYKYVFAEGAGHTDGAAMNQFLPEAMLWLWRGYPIAK